MVSHLEACSSSPDTSWSQAANDCRQLLDHGKHNSPILRHWLQYLEEAIDSYNFGLLDQDIFDYAAWQHPELLQVSLSLLLPFF